MIFEVSDLVKTGNREDFKSNDVNSADCSVGAYTPILILC